MAGQVGTRSWETGTGEPRPPQAGFFPDDASIRRLGREGVVILGGGRALLMQIAHPAVAAGVAEHSSFHQGRLKRLLRTLKPTLAIAFGSDEQAHAAAASINAMHSRVVGNGYRADDPGLLFWVLATLIDTTLLMHQCFLRPVSAAEAEAYYRDMVDLGGLLGVQGTGAPPDVDAFRSYMADMLLRLRVTDDARAIAGGLLGNWGVMTPLSWALREMTSALLPEGLRDAYGLSWSPRRELVASAVMRSSRLLLPRVPLRLRATPGFLMPAQNVGERAAYRRRSAEPRPRTRGNRLRDRGL